MKKEDIIVIMKEKSDSCIRQHKECYRLICWYVEINDVNIGNVNKIRFVDDVLWINETINISLANIDSFVMAKLTTTFKEE